ncbi:hypothetical protein PANT_7d00319 [Moesziomyces antarcticus T-34]|uniref:60S ribosomal protein L13a n=1 Tax=Pseudozyma antarctica (strain T-34) TaxID=1151754 RepID=M9LMN3_PSEA3|nr:hypothetical protein PANT_7d00319 [Moesziomyces antarcticus T-34]
MMSSSFRHSPDAQQLPRPIASTPHPRDSLTNCRQQSGLVELSQSAGPTRIETSLHSTGNPTLQFEEPASLKLMPSTEGEAAGVGHSQVSRCVREWVFETWLLVIIFDTTTTVKKHIVKVCIYIYAYAATDHLSASRSSLHAVDHTNNLDLLSVDMRAEPLTSRPGSFDRDTRQKDPDTRSHEGHPDVAHQRRAHLAMSLQQANPYIVDGKGHLLGRLAATLAKELLSGQKVVVVRSELINVSGSFFRNKLKYHAYLHKRHLVNPKKAGPFHHRAPSRILYKAIRGMLPHKTARGAAALQRLKVYEGVPPPYDRKKLMVIPAALRVLRLKPGRKFATIKRISHEVGWNHMETVDKLEAKRKVKQQAYHERQVAASKKRAAAQTATADKLKDVNAQLASPPPSHSQDSKALTAMPRHYTEKPEQCKGSATSNAAEILPLPRLQVILPCRPARRGSSTFWRTVITVGQHSLVRNLTPPSSLQHNLWNRRGAAWRRYCAGIPAHRLQIGLKRRWIDANRTFDPRLINLSLPNHGAAYRLAGSLRSINVQSTPPPHQHITLSDEKAPPSSPAMRNSTTYIPVPAGAPALPPAPAQAASVPASSMPAYQRLETPMGRLTERSSSPSSAHEIPPSLHPRWHAAASPAPAPAPEPAVRSSAPLPPRLKNPYDRTMPSVAQEPLSMQSPSSSNAPGRVSFGPGDPLFTANAPAAYPNPHSHQQPLPDRTLDTDTAGTRSIPNRTTARPEDVSDPTQPIIDSRAPAASHGEPGHEFDDCPGCRAELEDAIQASLQTAKQEEESRRRAPLEQQELDRLCAITSEEEERRRRLAMEEEALLLQAIEDSRREAEMQSQRHTNDEDVLLEESLQHALRQRDQDAIKESEMLQAAKMASEMHEQQRLERIESLRDAERKALQLSLQEQEEEWARRESAERSLLEFLEQRGHYQDAAAQLPTPQRPSSTSASPDPTSRPPSAVAAGDLEAEYWRFSGHDEAYRLALQMQQASLEEHRVHTRPASSGTRVRRPLPQTPTLRSESSSSQTHPVDSDSLHNVAPDSSTSGALGGAQVHAFPDPPRPALQQRSSSSSSKQSQSVDPLPLEQAPSPSSEWYNPYDAIRTTAGSGDPACDPSDPAPASYSIPKRVSSQLSTATRDEIVASSSPAPEQKGQRALAGIDFGYCSLPFAPNLDKPAQPSPPQSTATLSTSSHSTSQSGQKARFPASIVLSAAGKASHTAELDAAYPQRSAGEGSSGSFYVIRAHSWKSLLRALAWYGNTRVEASPEDVAAASEHRSGRCLLRAEIEFVTPTRVDLGMGVGAYAKAAHTSAGMPKHPSPAHVALCLSLLPVSSGSSSASSKEAGAWLKSDTYRAIKHESRRLDAWYAGKGSTRRLIQLSRQPPALPVIFVQIAQVLHASHAFSAACPSSGSTARHSPRDLHHAIERHDEGFVRKQKAMLAAGSALASQTGGLSNASTASLASSNPRFSLSGPSRFSGSTETHRESNEDDFGDEDDQDVDVDDFHLLEHGLAGDGSFDAQDKALMGKRHRFKAKVKRRLAKRSADGRVVDEDLAAWITPFDLSQHG